MADDPKSHEPRPDPHYLTNNPTGESSSGLDYKPHPEKSLRVSSEREKILKSICNLYSNGANEDDMRVYTEKAIYDDPYSYCDTRYKIAGQWYGLPKVMSSSRTLGVEVVSSTPTAMVFKLQQEYSPRLIPGSKVINSLISLAFEQVNGEEKVVYHKDMWNEKDYSHSGLGKVFKTLNGDYLTKITKPPTDL